MSGFDTQSRGTRITTARHILVHLRRSAAAPLLGAVAFMLSLTAGAFEWSWWTILLSSAIGFSGFFLATGAEVEMSQGRAGAVREVGLALFLIIVESAGLFFFGDLVGEFL